MGNALVWVVLGLLLLGFVGLGLLLLQIVRQQGRLLLRLEALETHARGAAVPAPQAQPAGLAVGTQVSFELPDLDGETISLERFRGRQVLLVHWSTTCGFCTQIAHELAELEDKLERRNTELVLLSYGDPEPNQALASEYGLRATILLLEGQANLSFSGLGTPAAYLLDEEGRVAEPLALGANEVPELARAAAEGRPRLASERPLADSRLEREGLKAGTEAPGFELEDVRGGQVSLHDYRGRSLLLVFSDPECGPCNALLPDLARLQDEAAIVLVSRGDRDVNRAKAEEHGLEFPVVVQQGWRLSKDYGIFATPYAFLIDEQGVIAKPVAKGKDEIVSLAREALERREAPLAH
jgi:peroxiredoxin